MTWSCLWSSPTCQPKVGVALKLHRVRAMQIVRPFKSVYAPSFAWKRQQLFTPRPVLSGRALVKTAGRPRALRSEMSAFHLYSFPLAFNPQKVLLAVEEKQLKGVKVQNVHLFNGESLQPWFMKINPASTVPALAVGDGRILNQTIDILRFIDEQGGGAIGGDKVDKARVKELVDALHAWDGNLYAFVNIAPGAKGVLDTLGVYRARVAQAQQKRAEAAGDQELATAYKNKIASMEAAKAEQGNAAVVEANKKELEQLLDRAEKLLEKDKYLAGSAVSMADVVMTTILFRVGTVQQTKALLGPRPKLSAYYNDMKSRPSFQKVFGPASSTFTQVSWIIPAVLKAKFAGLTGRY